MGFSTQPVRVKPLFSTEIFLCLEYAQSFLKDFPKPTKPCSPLCCPLLFCRTDELKSYLRHLFSYKRRRSNLPMYISGFQKLQAKIPLGWSQPFIYPTYTALNSCGLLINAHRSALQLRLLESLLSIIFLIENWGLVLIHILLKYFSILHFRKCPQSTKGMTSNLSTIYSELSQILLLS